MRGVANVRGGSISIIGLLGRERGYRVYTKSPTHRVCFKESCQEMTSGVAIILFHNFPPFLLALSLTLSAFPSLERFFCRYRGRFFLCLLRSF